MIRMTRMSDSKKSGARELASRLSAILYGFLAGKLPQESVPAKLRAIADWVEKGLPERKQPQKFDTEILEIFEHWQSVTNHTKAKLIPKRRAMIHARLREGYTVEQCKAAIDYIATDPFYHGDNKQKKAYDDLSNALRNGEQIEKLGSNVRREETDPEVAAELRRLQEGK